MILYRLRNTRSGRRRDEFPAGSLDFVDGRLALEVHDKALSKKLSALFAETYRVRRVCGSPETFLGHTWVDLQPGSEQHYHEGLRRLIHLDLMVDDENQPAARPFPNWVAP